MRRSIFLLLVLVWLSAACAPPGPNSSGSSTSDAAARPGRALVAAMEAEPKSLAARLIAQIGQTLHLRRIFNADLAMLDDQSNPLPYLAEALPQLNTDDWKVFPDGKMETTYRLRPSLAWHDGTPLTADAFVFATQVFSTRDFGQANSPPFSLISSVEAPDDRTVVIFWKEPYAAAGSLQSLGASAATGLPPLPRHILGPALESGAETFINHPHWTNEYVGLGPYRLDRWEPGAFLEASAFDRHALGTPKIQRIKIVFIADDNAVLANLLSGDALLADGLPVGQTSILMRQWPAGRGAMIPYSNSWTSPYFQGRPEMLSPAALQDRRVRQALAHALDRASLNEAIYEGQLPLADSLFPNNSELGRGANEGAIKYPFDLGRSAQLMTEAGFIKPPGGEFYVGPSGERFTPDLRGGTSTDQDKLTTAMASAWRQAGFDFTQSVLPTALVQDVQAKSSYPGLLISSRGGGEGGLNSMGTSQIPNPESQWRGRAWEGYSNPEFDRLIAAFSAALDPADRIRFARDIARVYTTDLVSIPLFFNVSPWVFTSDLTGPKLRSASSNPSWNIHEWELR